MHARPINDIATGWYVIFPEGSAWVAVHIGRDGRVRDIVEQASASTNHEIAEAVQYSQTSENITAEEASAVVAAWSADADPEMCVVERVVGV